MTKAIFTTKVSPTYDDLPEVRYHFPDTYLNQVRSAVGDWIVYYEPRRTSGDPSSRGGRQSYFATARVIDVRPDINSTGHHYAMIADYLEFDRVVSFKSGNQYFESALQRADGQTSKGAFGRSVRSLPDKEFELILAAGFVSPAAPDMLPRSENVEREEALGGTDTSDRPLVKSIVTRPFRDLAFRKQVRAAYDNRCAVSGLKLIDGDGRPEVQAAHIRPVASAGPDSVRNGIALSGTLHWMFDRGLISIDDDYTILHGTGVPDAVARLIRPELRLLLPENSAEHPHPLFLRFHREQVFIGT